MLLGSLLRRIVFPLGLAFKGRLSLYISMPVLLTPHGNCLLAPLSRRCLRLLFAFLFRVSLCSDDNKMNTENLGIVFAPNLLRSPNAMEISVIDLQVRIEGRPCCSESAMEVRFLRLVLDLTWLEDPSTP